MFKKKIDLNADNFSTPIKAINALENIHEFLKNFEVYVSKRIEQIFRFSTLQYRGENSHSSRFSRFTEAF